MVHVTILSIDKKEESELFEKVIAACDYCVEHDSTFAYETPETGGIRIFSPRGRNQAYKRGHYFFLKFGVHYEVIWQNDNKAAAQKKA
jgi:hypothetical protein